MFSYLKAIEALIGADPTATAAEKAAVLSALAEAQKVSTVESEVVSLADAATMLGYSSTKGVRKAIRAGALKGFYGGKGKRVTGVTRKSIREALSS